MILDVDLSQIEWRVVADITGDPVMIQEIKEGQDQHAHSCEHLMELPVTKDNRTDAKIFNFRAIYADPDSAPYAYYMDNKMPNFTKKKWDGICEGFFSHYAGMSQAHIEWIEYVRKHGTFTGPTGRIWQFVKENKRGIYDYSVTKIRNYPVQGTSGDVIKMALIKLNQAIKHIPECLLTMTVHDSIIMDMPEKYIEPVAKDAIEIFQSIPDLMKKYFDWEMKVPITGEADAGLSWGTTVQLEI
jgi:DNA polymerase-1